MQHDDTVRMPWDGESNDLVVRPALAILFRLAVGPAADRYGPRFLRYERRGGARVSWHWPAFLFGSAWAFYRRLWFTGVLFACFPIFGAAAFGALAPALADSTLMWLATALIAVWFVPASVSGLLANRQLYRHVRRRVARAEASSQRTDEAAARISARRPTSASAAVLLGIAASCAAAGVIAPPLAGLYHDQLVRVRVADRLAAVRPLQAVIEDMWRRGESLTRIALYSGPPSGQGVSVSAANGRVRVDLGAELPELRGKSILVAPAVGRDQRVQWICVPVDVPRKYLPQDCGRG